MHRLGCILSRPFAEYILQLDVMVNDETSMAVFKGRYHLLTSKETS
jgi:hypothetical protein